MTIDANMITRMNITLPRVPPTAAATSVCLPLPVPVCGPIIPVTEIKESPVAAVKLGKDRFVISSMAFRFNIIPEELSGWVM